MLKQLVLLSMLLVPTVSLAQVLKCYGRGANNVAYTLTTKMVPLFGNIKCAPVRYEEATTRFLEGVFCQTEHKVSIYFPNDDSWFCNKLTSRTQYNQWRCQGIGKYNARNFIQFNCRWENDREVPESGDGGFPANE